MVAEEVLRQGQREEKAPKRLGAGSRTLSRISMSRTREVSLLLITKLVDPGELAQGLTAAEGEPLGVGPMLHRVRRRGAAAVDFTKVVVVVVNEEENDHGGTGRRCAQITIELRAHLRPYPSIRIPGLVKHPLRFLLRGRCWRKLSSIA